MAITPITDQHIAANEKLDHFSVMPYSIHSILGKAKVQITRAGVDIAKFVFHIHAVHHHDQWGKKVQAR